ncbi:multimerin-2-like [Cololabis saira]|uniref:multimerin-2-like n=1 Tax=Cololabis saira TaxID=129043 RepID=UPI002AD3B36D|nr:multimerin-2-like [Cololabis saira]
MTHPRESLHGCLVYVAVLCGLRVAAGGPVDLTLGHRTTAGQQGSAVLFFAAYQGQLREVLFDPIIFNQVMVNQGSAYDNHTGVFTAPFAGVYQFVFAAQLCRGDHNNNWYFMTNGHQRMLCHAQMSGGDTSLNTCFYMEELKKGDQVWVKQKVGGCAWANSNSKTITFSGVLLAKEGISMLGGGLDPRRSCPPFSRSSSVVRSSGRTVVPMWTGVSIILPLCFFFL